MFKDFPENQMTKFQIWGCGALTVGGVWSRNWVLGGVMGCKNITGSQVISRQRLKFCY